MNTKKFLGALLALSVVVAMLAACAPKPTPTPDRKSVV